MRKVFFIALALTAAMLIGTSANFAGGKKKVKAKCPVSGKDIVKDSFVKHNGGKVYFCCPNCPAAFTAKTGKYAAKANQQLVVTGQAKQVKCPYTGRPMNKTKTVSVGGVEVSLCCGNCLAKAKGLNGAALTNSVFADKSFKKGFQVK